MTPAIVLGCIIAITELARVRKVLYVDFLRAVSLIFFAAFVVVPIIIHSLGLPDSARAFWMKSVNYNESSLSVAAQLTACLAYLAIRFGVDLGGAFDPIRRFSRKVSRSLSRLSPRVWFVVYCVLTIFSLVCLQLYSMRRGVGIGVLLQLSGRLRTGQYVPGIEETSFTFLTYAMQSVTAAFILVGLRDHKPRRGSWSRVAARLALNTGIGFAVVLAAIVLWMRAGRLHLINFFLVLLLYLVSDKKKPVVLRLLVGVSCLAIVALVTVFGKFLLGVADQVSAPDDALEFVRLVSMELAFPYLSLVNTIENVGAFRWFSDIPLALTYVFCVPLYVLISGVAPKSLPLSVAQVNTVNILNGMDYGEIPVDLVTFGYFSAGIPGVLITGLMFGMFLYFLEQAFPPGSKGVVGVLRVAWIVFVSTVGVLYADPANVLRDGLYLIGPTLGSLLVSVLLQGTRVLGRR